MLLYARFCSLQFFQTSNISLHFEVRMPFFGLKKVQGFTSYKYHTPLFLLTRPGRLTTSLSWGTSSSETSSFLRQQVLLYLLLYRNRNSWKQSAIPLQLRQEMRRDFTDRHNVSTARFHVNLLQHVATNCWQTFSKATNNVNSCKFIITNTTNLESIEDFNRIMDLCNFKMTINNSIPLRKVYENNWKLFGYWADHFQISKNESMHICFVTTRPQSSPA